MAKTGRWPAVSYEELSWVPSNELSTPRTQQRKQRGKYRAAIVPSIAAVRAVPVSLETAAAADEASVEITRFDSEFGNTVAPFRALLLRSESAASSKIERLTASAKAIALAELGDTRKHNARVIVANTRAMEAAVALANELDAQAIRNMHSVLMRDSEPDRAGRWREEQVWIGGSDFGPVGADFVPPKSERVPKAIDDLVRFLQRDDLPALIQATVAHAQFETIHPFADGNGRTGRALMHAALRGKGLAQNVTVPISAGLLVNTDRYFAALMAYRRGDIETLISMMVDAAFLAIRNGRQLVQNLERIRNEWTDLITAREGAAAWRVADLLIRQPIVDSPLVQRELQVTTPTANAAIDHLVDVGVITQVAGNFRYRKWAATSVLTALDEFAARAGRRG